MPLRVFFVGFNKVARIRNNEQATPKGGLVDAGAVAPLFRDLLRFRPQAVLFRIIMRYALWRPWRRW